MNFETFSHSITQISKYNFAPRDIEMQKAITKIVQEMSSRGLLHSTITLQKMAEFLTEEFKCRCTYIKDLLLNSIPNFDYKKVNDPTGKIKTFYQEI